MRNAERVVIDTNVFVGGLLRISSLPGRAAAKAFDRSILLVSQDTLTELADVLAREKFDRYVSRHQRTQFLRFIATSAKVVPIIHRVSECRDPQDDKFLEVALNGRANVIVTSDADLLVLHPWRSVAIVSPSQFLSASDAI